MLRAQQPPRVRPLGMFPAHRSRRWTRDGRPARYRRRPIRPIQPRGAAVRAAPTARSRRRYGVRPPGPGRKSTGRSPRALVSRRVVACQRFGGAAARGAFGEPKYRFVRSQRQPCPRRAPGPTRLRGIAGNLPPLALLTESDRDGCGPWKGDGWGRRPMWPVTLGEGFRSFPGGNGRRPAPLWPFTGNGLVEDFPWVESGGCSPPERDAKQRQMRRTGH
jgi:hypothetical protein